MATSSTIRRVGPIFALLALGGCGARDCMMGIAHRDCVAQSAPVAAFPQVAFPQDDAVCRSYGLTPGTPDYAICRQKKRHVRVLTGRETDYGALQNPLTPDLR
jgi:hypothetical protein